MASCVEDNFEEDLLGWTYPQCKAGRSGQEVREEVWVPLRHRYPSDILCFLNCWSISLFVSLLVEYHWKTLIN